MYYRDDRDYREDREVKRRGGSTKIGEGILREVVILRGEALWIAKAILLIVRNLIRRMEMSRK
jgi:hypothetical protein